MSNYTLLYLLAVVLFASCSGKQTEIAEQPERDTIPMMVMQIRQCARLHAAEIRLHKIITHHDDVRLKGNFLSSEFDVPLPMSKRKVAIPMDATVRAYIDFSQFSEKNVVRQGSRIRLLLPRPQVELVSTTIDHDNIRRRVSLIRSDFSDAELSAYERQGREDILRQLSNLGIEETARQSATRLLVPMLTRLGFNEGDITITFVNESDSPSGGSLKKGGAYEN